MSCKYSKYRGAHLYHSIAMTSDTNRKWTNVSIPSMVFALANDATKQTTKVHKQKKINEQGTEARLTKNNGKDHNKWENQEPSSEQNQENLVEFFGFDFWLLTNSANGRIKEENPKWETKRDQYNS